MIDLLLPWAWMSLIVCAIAGIGVMLLLILQLYWWSFDSALRLIKAKKILVEYICYRHEFKEFLEWRKERS